MRSDGEDVGKGVEARKLQPRQPADPTLLQGNDERRRTLHRHHEVDKQGSDGSRGEHRITRGKVRISHGLKQAGLETVDGAFFAEAKARFGQK